MPCRAKKKPRHCDRGELGCRRLGLDRMALGISNALRAR
jgi:hypothetical protein